MKVNKWSQEELEELSDEELMDRYRELGVRCADDLVMDNDPTEQDYFSEVQDLFSELARREER